MPIAKITRSRSFATPQPSFPHFPQGLVNAIAIAMKCQRSEVKLYLSGDLDLGECAPDIALEIEDDVITTSVGDTAPRSLYNFVKGMDRAEQASVSVRINSLTPRCCWHYDGRNRQEEFAEAELIVGRRDFRVR